MTLTARRLLFVSSVLFLLSQGVVRAYDQAEADKLAEEKHRFETVTTKEGFKFSIPSDMPIERKDGLVQPIPFDEYLYIKFKKIEERVAGLEKQMVQLDKSLSALSSRLDAKFDALEKLIDSRLPAEPEPSEQPSA